MKRQNGEANKLQDDANKRDSTPTPNCCPSVWPAPPSNYPRWYVPDHVRHGAAQTQQHRLVDCRRGSGHRLAGPAGRPAVDEPCLVFPGEYVAPERVVTEVQVPSGKRPLFVLLDATWPQARKMFRKSPYLNHLPVLSLQPRRWRTTGKTRRICACGR